MGDRYCNYLTSEQTPRTSHCRLQQPPPYPNNPHISLAANPSKFRDAVRQCIAWRQRSPRPPTHQVNRFVDIRVSPFASFRNLLPLLYFICIYSAYFENPIPKNPNPRRPYRYTDLPSASAMRPPADNPSSSTISRTVSYQLLLAITEPYIVLIRFRDASPFLPDQGFT